MYQIDTLKRAVGCNAYVVMLLHVYKKKLYSI